MKIVYPAEREISEAEVVQWARDLLIDQAFDEAVGIERTRYYDQIIPDPELDRLHARVVADTPTPELDAAMRLLEDEGKVTFSLSTHLNTLMRPCTHPNAEPGVDDDGKLIEPAFDVCPDCGEVIY